MDTIFYTEIDEKEILAKYFYYFMKKFNLKRLSTNTTRPSITQESLNKILIPLPSLIIQGRIVAILDKFQKLVDEANGLD